MQLGCNFINLSGNYPETTWILEVTILSLIYILIGQLSSDSPTLFLGPCHQLLKGYSLGKQICLLTRADMRTLVAIHQFLPREALVRMPFHWGTYGQTTCLSSYLLLRTHNYHLVQKFMPAKEKRQKRNTSKPVFLLSTGLQILHLRLHVRRKKSKQSVNTRRDFDSTPRRDSCTT